MVNAFSFVDSGWAGGRRQVQREGREIRIEAGKRAEYPVPAGKRAVLYALEGSVRLEGDDSAVGGGDTVFFKPPAPGDDGMVGVEADNPEIAA